MTRLFHYLVDLMKSNDFLSYQRVNVKTLAKEALKSHETE